MQKRTTDPKEINFKDKFSLEGKVVVISGACGLIGRAFCEAAAQWGAHVVCADIALAQPEQFAADLEQRHGKKMLGFALNVAIKAEVEQLHQATLEAFGHIDGLVCGCPLYPSYASVPLTRLDSSW